MDERVAGVFDLIKEIEPLLHDHDPAVQGAALAQLLAKWLAGHHGSHATRMAVLDLHLVGVRHMLPIVLKELENHND